MNQYDQDMIDLIEDPAIQTRIVELVDQLAAANAEIEELRESLNETLVRKQDALKQLTAANTKVEKLRVYARHKPDCFSLILPVSKTCDCGYKQALADTEPK